MNNSLLIIIAVLIVGGLGYLLLTPASDTPAVMNDDMPAMDEVPTPEDDMMAEPMAETPAQPNIVETAVAADDFNTLVAAVTAAELAPVLAGDGPFTVFAPTDAAFAELPDGTLDTLLLPDSQGDLASILTYHVVPGAVLAGDLSDGMTVETVNGDTITIGVAADGTVTVNDATVVSADIEASNGVIHVIDTVLIPSAE